MYTRGEAVNAENTTDQRRLRAAQEAGAAIREDNETRTERGICPVYILLSANAKLFTMMHRHYGNLPRIRNAAPG